MVILYIKCNWLNNHLAGYPWLKPTDMIRALVRWKRLDAILPEKDMESSAATLRTYWQRFHAAYPTHEIFEKLTEDMYSTTLPIKIHGDEGRSNSTELILIFDVLLISNVWGARVACMIRMFLYLEWVEQSRQKKNSDHAAKLAALFGKRNLEVDP